MFKKISLLWTIICILCLHSLISQAATTNLAYTCAELGFTQTSAECEGKKMLLCPFDKSAVFCGKVETCTKKDCTGYTLASCPEGDYCESCITGCGDDLIRYKKEEAIVFLADASANQKLVFSASGGDLSVDWGDGTIDSNQTHTYKKSGVYKIKIKGTITSFKLSAVNTTIKDLQMLSLKLPSITSMLLSYGQLTGTIPEFPPNLEDGTDMFYGCTGLTGPIPALPKSFTNGYRMFYECSGLTGPILGLQSNLTNGQYMFQGCSNLTGSIPTLPDSLSNGFMMFYSCSKLTGAIPNLPNNLTNGTGMFENCSGLTDSIPTFPNTLTNGDGMFSGCSNLTGSIPTLPNILRWGDQMFYGCSKLTGTVPLKPSTLTSYTDMFYGTQVTNDGSWPSSAW